MGHCKRFKRCHECDFRDYMLSFLFLRYLSHNYEVSAKKELGSDYPNLAEDAGRTPLGIWYATNEEDVPEFEKQMRRKVHYVIKPDHLWSNISELARTQNGELLVMLEEGFRYIENESFDNSFQGLFSEINLNSEKLGKTPSERNKKLCNIIQKIAEGIADFSTDTDTLGDAYEYLIGQFAAGAGKKAGEFYTPQQISTILSEIVTLDSQAPSTGKKSKLGKVLDFACGSGSLLLNMLLHGMKDTEFEIYHGDTLKNQWDILNEMNPSKKIEFDAIVANPLLASVGIPTIQWRKISDSKAMV